MAGFHPQGIMNKPVELSLDDSRFARLAVAKRVWAVGSIHGDADKLKSLHDTLLPRFENGDRLVYMGNYSGPGQQVRATFDELLRARRKFLARPGVFEAVDFVYLRGAQEEMWSKLLQLQFATNPREIFEWLIDHGLGPIIEAYGGNLTTARGHVRDGPIAITKWTSALRSNIHKAPGHYELSATLKRAAYTECGGLLFVHASVDPTRPLHMQGDIFWWDTGIFDGLDSEFSGFARVIRGYDHKRRGVQLEKPHAATVDGGSGYGGQLSAVCFLPDGQVVDRIDI